MRMTVLAAGLAGYLERCFTELANLGVELQVITPTSMPNAEYRCSLDAVAEVHPFDGAPSAKWFLERVQRFAPDVILASRAGPRAYRRVLRRCPKHVVRVMPADNQWWGTPRQHLGRLLRRWYVAPYFDCAFVPSDRSERYVRKLGFDASNVIRGSNSADVELFAIPPRSGSQLRAGKGFIFVGRLIPYKAVDLLAEAYANYRSAVSYPWPLQVVGSGPLSRNLEAVPGVVLHGSLQPADVAKLMQVSSCFVLPSRAEHYGVVVHEAAAAGLPLLVSHTAGAVPGLLQDGVNGRAVSRHSAEAWTQTLCWLSGLPNERLGEMSSVSSALATRISPQAWAVNLVEQLEDRMPA